MPLPRAITIQASLVRSVASSGGAATTGGSALGCTARVRPFLRDLEHGGVVTLGPDRFRVVPRGAGVDVVEVGDGWMPTSERRIASEVDYDVVEIAGGEPVMHGHVSLECESETSTAASQPVAPVTPAAPVAPTDYGATQSCSAVAVAPGQVLTNLPSVGYVNDGAADVVLVSSTFIAGPTAMSWVGEIRNDRRTIMCPDMRLGMDGTAPAPVPFVAEQHVLRGSEGWVFPCIDPGEVAVAYQTYLHVSLADVIRAGAVHYEIHDAEGIIPIRRTGAGRPHATVTRTIHDTTAGLDWYEARGTVHGTSIPIENVMVHVFPRDPCGLLSDEVTAFATVPTSGDVSFATMNGAPFDFRRWLVFLECSRVPPS